MPLEVDSSVPTSDQPDHRASLVTDQALDLFHPTLQCWFREQIGTPTDAQAKAWPHIAEGEHVLVTAPPGSGKTLTAFLWALNQLLCGFAGLECSGRCV